MRRHGRQGRSIKSGFWARLGNTISANRRWWIHFPLAVLTLAIVTWGWLWLHNPRTFPIKKVQIEGRYTHVAKQDIIQMALPYVDAGFFSLDSHRLKRHILSLPWVSGVAVRRIWPDIVVIHISEQQPVARWDAGSLLTDSGEVFTPEYKTIPQNLPRLFGPEGQQQQVLGQYREMNRLLAKVGLSIQQLHLSSRWSWWLRLDNGMTVLLGQVEPVARLQRFVIVYNTVFGSRGTAASRVDLRYANGMAVNWRQSAT